MQSKHPGLLFAGDGRRRQEIERQIGAASAPVCCGEERAERESEAVDLPDDQRPWCHTWPRAEISDRESEIADTRGGKELPPKAGWTQNRAATPLQYKEDAS